MRIMPVNMGYVLAVAVANAVGRKPTMRLQAKKTKYKNGGENRRFRFKKAKSCAYLSLWKGCAKVICF